MPSRFAVLLLSGAAFFATSLPAAAIEPEEAADALAAAIAGENNVEVTYDTATEDDDGNFVIEGLTLAQGGDDKGNMVFAEVVIEAPTDNGDAIFDSPLVTFSEGTLTGKSKGSIGAAELTAVSVLDPATVEGEGPAKGILFETAEATDLKVTRPDGPGEMTIGRIFVEVGNVVDNVPQDSSGSIEAVTIPPEFFAGSEVTPATIGYDSLVLGATWDGSRDPDAKTMTIRDFTLSVKDGGDLSIVGTMGNLPEAGDMNDKDAGSKAIAVELHTVTVRYEDKSLAGRILEFMAKQQGITRAEYAEQMSAALPFLLAAVNNPAFQNALAGALGAFLKDPQSLTIKLEPTGPVSGQEIISIAGSAPQTLPDRLNASVTANTAE